MHDRNINIFTGFLFCLLLSFIYCTSTSKSYAYEHILTDSDIRTVCDNNFGANSGWNDLFYDKIKALKDEFYSYNYDVIIINMYSSSYHQVDVFGTASSRIAGVNNLNNKNYMEITMQGNGIKASIVQNGYNAVRVDRSGLSSPNTYPVGSGAQNRSNYLLYTNDLGSSVVGPYQNLSWLQFVPPKIYEIDLNTTSSTQYISIITDSNETISHIPVLYDNSFGEFLDDQWMSYWYYGLDFWYWDGSDWVNKILYIKTSNDGFVRLLNNDYMSFTYYDLGDRTYEEVGLTIKDLYAFKNVIFHFQVINGNNDSADGFFLFGDNNTTITNGTIDTSSLPSDYLDQFKNLDIMVNDNNNTQNIIDSITDDSEVGLIIDDFFSGDLISGDGSKWSYHDYYSSFNDNYWSVVNSIIECFYYDGDPYIDIILRDGSVERIYASQYTTPLTPMKVFISSVLIYLYIVVMYEVQRKWILEITEGNLYVLHHADADEYFYM